MISLALALAAATVAEQLAPAKQGMLQCGMPDVLFKTCAALSKVWQVGPDSYRYETDMLVDPDGPVVVTVRDTVTVGGSSVCEVIRLSDIDSWTVKVGGAPASPAQAAKHRAAMKRKFAPFAGQTACSAIVPNEQSMHKVIGTIGGKRIPAFDYAMKWVGPEDDWKVAP